MLGSQHAERVGLLAHESFEFFVIGDHHPQQVIRIPSGHEAIEDGIDFADLALKTVDRIRLIGMKDADDLIADLDQALSR